MRVCGIKASHDATIAVLEDSDLLFSVELEKIGNRERHSHLDNAELIASVLGDFGLSADDIDAFVIDGWFEGNGTSRALIDLPSSRGTTRLRVNSYLGIGNRMLDSVECPTLPLQGSERALISYPHLASHVVGTWSCSPFAQNDQDANVLVWDGGTIPRLYHVQPTTSQVHYLGALHSLVGNFYSVVAQFFEPFCRPRESVRDDFSIPGKLMAYVALGDPHPRIVSEIAAVYRTFEASCDESPQPTLESTILFGAAVRERMTAIGVEDVDALAAFHVFSQDLLLNRLGSKLESLGKSRPLCFSGGCALNIKWNSAIRKSQLVDDFWVPPFPSDTGSAIGAACCYRFDRVRPGATAWQVYAGPKLIRTNTPVGWSAENCTIGDLAQSLATVGEPVVFLTGRAELGPRALGHRSILAPPGRQSTKDLLNRLKQREAYRPVAPICLESKASRYFAPGTPDPFMLYEHAVRAEGAGQLSAVMHLDGSARLQTVSHADEPLVANLLEEYERLAGIPVLCNTSANFKGRGFFTSVADAADWGQVPRIWSDGVLYSRLENQ